MDTPYYRIEAYSLKYNCSFIIDSHGYFDNLCDFIIFILDNGFKIKSKKVLTNQNIDKPIPFIKNKLAMRRYNQKSQLH